MNMEALERALKENPNAKFIYTIPTFQNPSGVTMSWEKRRRLYELAKQYGVIVAETTPYGELRFEGKRTGHQNTGPGWRGSVCGQLFQGALPRPAGGLCHRPQGIAGKDDRSASRGGCPYRYSSPDDLRRIHGRLRFRKNILEHLRAIYRHKAGLMLSLIDRHLVPAGVTYDPFRAD